MSYIPPIPGSIKNPDDSQTNLLEALGLNVDPVDLKGYNGGYHMPPIATIEIDGAEYPLAAVLGALKSAIVDANPIIEVEGTIEDDNLEMAKGFEMRDFVGKAFHIDSKYYQIVNVIEDSVIGILILYVNDEGQIAGFNYDALHGTLGEYDYTP